MNDKFEDRLLDRFRDISWLIALIFLVIVVFAWYNRIATVLTLGVPLEYSGDGVLVFANAKAYMDGEIIPIFQKWVAQLGAPYQANWNDWPITEDLIYAGIGWLGRYTGLFLAGNITLFSCHLFAAVSFWCVGRELHLRREYVFLGAVAYAFSPYIMSRGLHHVVLSMYWHLPWLCLVSWWNYEREESRLSSRRGCISLVVSLVTGALNPYYSWIYIQFLGFAILKHLVNRRFRAILSVATLILSTLSTFTLFNSDTMYYRFLNGENVEIVSRNLAGLEVFGLKIPELILPPAHRWKYLADFAQACYYSVTFVKGEIGQFYLGGLGIVGFIWLLGQSLFRLLRDRPGQVSPAFWQIIWVILYSLIGGINLVLGSFGLVLFRGTNRYSIVILTLSLLFLVQALSKSFHTRFTPLVVFSCLFFVLWDQLPARSSLDQIQLLADKVELDRTFAENMERVLPSEAMVFQLPVMSYPESPPIFHMRDYEHLLPYLYTKSLRYSYGSNKGRADTDWQKVISELPVSEILSYLESYGFDAIMINRNGYEDHAGQLVKEIRQKNKKVISENADFVAFKLNPALKPVLPTSIHFGQGWSVGEIDHRWAISNTAEIMVNNPSCKQDNCEISFDLRGLQRQKIKVSLNKELIYETSIYANDKPLPILLPIKLLPGVNSIILESDVTPSMPGNGDSRTLAFDISRFNVK